MKNFAAFFILLTLNNSAFSQEKKQNSSDSNIAWSKGYKLQWGDFTGKMNPDIFAYAVTSYKIEILPENVQVDSKNNIINYHDLTALAKFHKNQSWTVSNDLDLLNHERLHFDIAELFARKIRKSFFKLKTAKERSYTKYWNTYTLLWNECRLLQKHYDLETNHGTKKIENDKWIAKIKALL